MIVLAIFNGWGIAAPNDGNAITRAQTPGFDELIKKYPSLTLAVAAPFTGASGYQALGQNLTATLAATGRKQLAISEQESFLFVNYFLQKTGSEKITNLEEIILPDMDIEAITAKALAAIEKNTVDFLLISLANADVLAHGGDLAVTAEVVEVLDKCLEKIARAVLSKDGVLLFTSDHGNAEALIDIQTDTSDKTHTTNPVPLIIVGNQYEGKNLGQSASGSDLSVMAPAGKLEDVAPTIVKLLGIKQPEDMRGKSLI